MKISEKSILVDKEYYTESLLENNGIFFEREFIWHFFSENYYDFTITSLERMLENNFINGGFIYFYRGYTDDTQNETKFKEKIQINKKGISKFTKMFGEDESDQADFDLEMNIDYIKDFLGMYLLKWKEGILYSEGQNYLNFKTQIDKIIKLIYKDLLKYSDKSLFIIEEKFNLSDYETINLFAIVIYLESIGTIKILSYEVGKYPFEGKKGFRIEILDTFYDNFEDPDMPKDVTNNKNNLFIKYLEEQKYILINGIQIILSNTQNEYFKLVLDLDILNLKVNFEDLAIEFDKNFNEFDEDKRKKEIKRYYNTFNEMNKKIKLTTQIDKLFITTIESISLNPKYNIKIEGYSD